MERRAARADIAGEHDNLLLPAFLHGDFETRRSEDVSGFDGPHADAWSNLCRIVVSQPAVERMQSIHFFLRVERLDQRLALRRSPPVLALRILALQIRGILEDQF